jgi:hypothetical protein
MVSGQLTSILQDEPIIPSIDGIPVIAGIPGICPVVFEGFMPMVVGKAIGGIPVGMDPVASMLNNGKRRKMKREKLFLGLLNKL